MYFIRFGARSNRFLHKNTDDGLPSTLGKPLGNIKMAAREANKVLPVESPGFRTVLPEATERMESEVIAPAFSSMTSILHSLMPYLKMMFFCVHLSIRDFQETRNSEFLQKVTKETKSRSFCPDSSFPSLPSVKSERMHGFDCGSAALGSLCQEMHAGWFLGKSLLADEYGCII